MESPNIGKWKDFIFRNFVAVLPSYEEEWRNGGRKKKKDTKKTGKYIYGDENLGVTYTSSLLNSSAKITACWDSRQKV